MLDLGAYEAEHNGISGLVGKGGRWKGSIVLGVCPVEEGGFMEECLYLDEIAFYICLVISNIHTRMRTSVMQ